MSMNDKAQMIVTSIFLLSVSLSFIALAYYLLRIAP